MPRGEAASRARVEIWEHPSGDLQLNIANAEGGYRIFGPKFNGTSRLLRAHVLSDADTAEIQRLLLGRRTPHDGDQPSPNEHLHNALPLRRTSRG